MGEEVEQVELVDGCLVPVDPMEALGCDSCQ